MLSQLICSQQAVPVLQGQRANRICVFVGFGSNPDQDQLFDYSWNSSALRNDKNARTDIRFYEPGKVKWHGAAIMSDQHAVFAGCCRKHFQITKAFQTSFAGRLEINLRNPSQYSANDSLINIFVS